MNQIDTTDIGFGGATTGYVRVAALGNNPDVDTVSAEDIWSGGGAYPWMTGATSLEVVSDSANDAALGTGARTCIINGLDVLYAERAISVTLSGTTPVALTTPLYRINSALITSAGSGKTNAGSITIRDAGGGTTRALIPAGYGITRQSQFTVPRGWTLQVISQLFGFNRSSASARSATFATFIQSSSGMYRMPLEITVGDDQPYRHDGIPGITIPEKTDFGYRCTYVSNDNSDLTGAWLGVMKRN
jgi:hypothetical protein